MTTTFLATVSDGKLIPQEPTDLPEGSIVNVRVDVSPVDPDGRTALQRLHEKLRQLPSDPEAPIDGAAEVDHYLYNLPKRGQE